MEEYKEITLETKLCDIPEEGVEWFIDGKWLETKKQHHLPWLVSELKKGNKYRYRIKPLEPMKITKKVMELIYNELDIDMAVQKDWKTGQILGRRVEIID